LKEHYESREQRLKARFDVERGILESHIRELERKNRGEGGSGSGSRRL
jgi:hypothetical protein